MTHPGEKDIEKALKDAHELGAGYIKIFYTDGIAQFKHISLDEFKREIENLTTTLFETEGSA